ncbi:MAG: bifunctional riboflavin kinase/FAD synthetase [Chloroflexi bacterium]|nr:bifunctional riboflavin kinase/FAD synthetase [Chloroflexota bacterium]
MKSIDVIKQHSQRTESIVTIGTFDGVHKGHEIVFDHLKNNLSLTPIVITFNKSPKEIINHDPIQSIYEISTKKKLIKNLGVEKIISIDFDDSIKSLKADEFISLLKEYLKLKVLVIGEDTTIGKDKIGKKNGLNDLLLKFDANLKLIEIKESNKEKISSSEIKKQIINGNLREVNKKLPNKYFMEGYVAEGKKLGRKLGYPTANLKFSKEIVIPKDGIYKTISVLEDKSYNSITSIGNNPTFNEKLKTVETYIIDFNQNIYSQKFKIIFVDFIREQIKFDNEQDLINQMNKDLKKIVKDNSNEVY